MKEKKRGRKPCLSQFKEFPEYHQEGIKVKWSIHDWHDRYVELEDLTGYKPALELVGSWKEWERMVNMSSQLSSLIDEWNEEIKIKIKSRAIEKVTSLIDREDSVGLSAAKWISEEGWDKRKAGRPTKAQIESEKKKLAKEANETSEEFGRIMEALDASKEMQ